VKGPPWRSASVASRSCRGKGVRLVIAMRERQEQEMGKNEEDGGEDGKRASRVGLYVRSGGRGTILERGALNRFA
jgi:hypothetical protein